MHRSRKLSAWAALVLLLALVGLALPAQADEAAHWSPQRTGPRPTQPVWSLSCPTVHDCTAVNGVGSAMSFDGHAWGKTRTADHDLSGLTSVSCPSTSFCAAVGGRVAAIEKHGHWGKVHSLDFVTYSVSCASSHWCLAVGQGGHTLRYDGHAWHSGPRAETSLFGVSCVTQTFCMATAYTISETRVFRYDGRGWHRQGQLPITFNEQNGSLSCGSPRFCVAAGRGPTTARWNGHRWIQHALPFGPNEAGAVSCGAHFCELLTTSHAVEWHDGWGVVGDIPGGSDLDDASPLSCPARGRCVAVTTHLPDQTLTLHGQDWLFGAFPDSPDVVRHLSCPRSSFCMGVEDGSTARMLRDGSWSAVAMPAGWNGGIDVTCTSPSFCLSIDFDGDAATWDGVQWAAAGEPGQFFYSFDCATATYCVAGREDGSIVIWDGLTWTMGPTLQTSDIGSMSCPATDDCWIGNEESAVSHFDGATWSTPQKIAPTGVDGANTLTVRCATSARCVAADQRGNLYRFDGQAWHGQKHVGAVIAVDCGSARSCTAVLGGRHMGEVARWTGQTWTTSRAMPDGYYNFPQSMSCPTKAVCYLVDQSGNSWVRH